MAKETNRPVALVTGGGRRLGAAIARRLSADGFDLVLHVNRSLKEAEALGKELRRDGTAVWIMQADLTDAGAAKALVGEVVKQAGHFDLLVASAANFERVRWDDVDAAAWDRAMHLNLRAPWLLAQAASGPLADQEGSIVFITCLSASVPFKNYLPYVVSKGALQQLMRVLALELAPAVRVNAVAPGTVLPPPDLEVEVLARLRERTPLQKLGGAEDAAAAVSYLAQASHVTGQEIIVDGGRSVGAMT